MRNSRNIISFLYFGILLLMFIPQSAFAGSEHNLSGWAWSSNIGWISFNSTNTSSPSPIDYGVNKDANGNLSGWAWSSNIGWIEFGGLSSFPVGIGTTPANAQVQSDNTVTGWARACAGTATGDCETMTSKTDGWDGWISLSGTAPGGHYGVNLSGSNSSWAWGGPVVGWISFNPDLSQVTPAPTTPGPGCSSTSDCGVAIASTPTTPGFTLQCDGINLISGQTVSNTATKNISATPTSFTNPITVSIQSPLSLPNGVTAQYSFDGGATYSSAPMATLDCTNTNSPYCSPQPNLSVKLSGPIPADGTTYSIVVSGQSSTPSLSNSCTVYFDALKPGLNTPSGNNNTQFNEF